MNIRDPDCFPVGTRDLLTVSLGTAVLWRRMTKHCHSAVVTDSGMIGPRVVNSESSNYTSPLPYISSHTPCSRPGLPGGVRPSRES